MNDKKIKTAPNSKESEMLVLGSMLTSFNNLNTGMDSLLKNDFYYREHSTIYEAVYDLYKQDKPADVHLVAEKLKQEDKLKGIGGINYLVTLAQYAGTSAYIEEYIKIIKDKAVLRNMINASELVIKAALQENQNVEEILDETQAKFFQISQTSNAKYGILIKDLLSGEKSESNIPYLKELQERQEIYQEKGPQASNVLGIPTYFSDLDKLIGGITPSNLMILASRPAMGKTAFALNLAENIAIKNNIPIGIFSLEMTAEQLLHRIICSHSEVESEKVKTGSLNGLEYQRIVSSVNSLTNASIVIDDQPGLKITDLRSRARRMKEAYNIGFLIIDYLQLISGSGTHRSQENRQNEISEISRMLKTLARELNIPILCLSQLSRKVEERVGHRPQMSDLRESGSIEQDSDLVLFLLRREYYDPYDKPRHAELIIAKNRHGSIGSIDLTFRKELAQFTNYFEKELT